MQQSGTAWKHAAPPAKPQLSAPKPTSLRVRPKAPEAPGGAARLCPGAPEMPRGHRRSPRSERGADGGCRGRTGGGGGAWEIRLAAPEEALPGPGGGTAALPTFRRAERPRQPRRRWYRMQIRRLTSEIMWVLA